MINNRACTQRGDGNCSEMATTLLTIILYVSQLALLLEGSHISKLVVVDGVEDKNSIFVRSMMS